MTKRIALVTGASSGIGESTAQLLSKNGYTVYAGARRLDRMGHLERDGIHVVQLDVTDDDSMTAIVDQILHEQGRIDVLVNAAGYGSYGALEDVPIEEAKRQFDVNLFGIARLTQLVLPHMRSERYGKIVNISSIGGKTWEALGTWYHASKFALEGFSDSLRVEVKPFGVDVIIIQPGGIKTEWQKVTADNLLKTSGNGAYKEQAQAYAAAIVHNDRAPEPIVIAREILKAITVRNPKTRYVKGAGTFILTAQKLMTDKMFDRFIVMALKLMARLLTKDKKN